MFALVIALLVSFAAAFGGYAAARRFVRERLRYVDAIHRPSTPWLAGLGATLLAAVVTTLLPFIGLGAAVSFGLAVGMGVAAGARDAGPGPRWIGDGR